MIQNAVDEKLSCAVERHEVQIKSLQHQIDEIKTVTKEIKTITETLILLTGELKHTNENLQNHDARISSLENVPKLRLNTVVNAVITALCSGACGYVLAHFFGI